MSLRRSTSPTGRRALVAAGLAAALVAVPGTAAAADPDPITEVTTFLEGLAADGSSAQAVPGLPAFEVPPEIRDAFQQLAAAAMLPENCVDGVADAIELILDGLIALPLELADVLAGLLELLGGGGVPLPEELAVLEDLLDQLLGGLSGHPAAAPVEDDAPAEEDAGAENTAAGLALPGVPGIPGLPVGGTEEEPPVEGDTPELPTPTLIDGLLALGDALLACIPAPPAAGGGTAPPTTPVATPTQQPPAATPTPQAPAPVAAPVAYLGYAPTGADTVRADDASLPLTAVAGGLVLLAGAGAAGYGMRGRAVRTRD